MNKIRQLLFQLFRGLYRLVKYVLMALCAFLIYEGLLSNILINPIHIVLYILLWLFTSYIVLPKITRQVTRLYVPDYFFGRTRTIDGLLGDPINLAFQGELHDIVAMFQKAGWHVADKLSFRTSCKIVLSVLLRKSYACAPVSPLYVFNRQQDIAFEYEIGNSPRKRHHIRLWKVPDDYFLPGGLKVSWLAAATRDDNIGISLFTGQITHKIDSNIDGERDYVLDSLLKENSFEIQVLPYFTDRYRSRNGGGDQIYTDGTLKIVMGTQT